MNRKTLAAMILLAIFTLSAFSFAAPPEPVELFDLVVHSVWATTTDGCEAEGYSEVFRGGQTAILQYHFAGDSWTIPDLVNEYPYYSSWYTALTPTEENIVPYLEYENLESFQTQEDDTPVSVRTHTFRWDFVTGQED